MITKLRKIVINTLLSLCHLFRQVFLINKRITSCQDLKKHPYRFPSTKKVTGYWNLDPFRIWTTIAETGSGYSNTYNARNIVT